MRILICEDELIIAEYIKELCVELGHQVCGTASGVSEAFSLLETSQPEMVLLDISMDERLSGIRIARQINDTLKVPFIFITAFSDVETVQKAVETNPHAYLVKPIDKKTLEANIYLALYKFKGTGHPKAKDAITVQTESGPHAFVLEKLMYIESSRNYCELVYEDGNKELIRTTLQNLEEVLPSRFVRIHKSFIINADFLSGSSNLKAILNQFHLPIGRTYKNNLTGYLEKKLR